MRHFNRPNLRFGRELLFYLASRIASIHVLQSVSVAAFSSYCRWFSLLYDIAKQCCNRRTIKNSVISNVEGMTAGPTKSAIPPSFDLRIVRVEKCRREANRRRFKEEIAILSCLLLVDRMNSVSTHFAIYTPYKSGNLLSDFINCSASSHKSKSLKLLFILRDSIISVLSADFICAIALYEGINYVNPYQDFI